jgi:hypothetical protein
MHDLPAGCLPLQLTLPSPPPAPPQEPVAGLAAVPLLPGTRLLPGSSPPGPVSLAWSVVLDYRERCRLTYRVGTTTCEHVADCASHNDRHYLPLPPGAGPACPVEIVATDGPPLWVATAPGVAPCLVPDGPPADPLAAFLHILEHNCRGQFGWMGGCVLEAFAALAPHDPARWQRAWAHWLAPYLRPDGLRFQDRQGAPVTNELAHLELTLPFASLLRHLPSHPANALAERFWRAHQPLPGIIQDGRFTSAEANYTVAYPLMVLATQRGDEALRELAIRQLRYRRIRLAVDGRVYARNPRVDPAFPNWCRGVTWYLLGLVQTLLASGTPTAWPDLAEHLAERADWLARLQLPSGLWPNFLDEPALPPDTSGSAGLATVLLLATQHGLAGADYRAAARRCWDGLLPCLHADGWLGGCAPDNKRGEAVQRQPGRTTTIFAMGLAGQLAGHLASAGLLCLSPTPPPHA